MVCSMVIQTMMVTSFARLTEPASESKKKTSRSGREVWLTRFHPYSEHMLQACARFLWPITGPPGLLTGSRSGAGLQGVFAILPSRRVSVYALHSLSTQKWVLVLRNAC